MKNTTLSVIVLLVILIFLLLYYDQYGVLNSVRINNFRVHSEHNDKPEAAAILAEVDRRLNIMVDSFRNEYAYTAKTFNPDKKNYVDVIPVSGVYGSETANMQNSEFANPEYIQERIYQLVQNYKPGTIREISPLNRDGNTSYTVNKHDLVLCIRSRENPNNLHNINLIMFVALHELTHMMTKSWGHGPEFWDLFRFVLRRAIDLKVYIPVDYHKHPREYCGMNVNSSPIY